MTKAVCLDRPQPLFRQLLAHYEDAISGGELVPGDRLPATTEIAQRFQVAPSTVQEALGLLQQRGLVDRVPGRGTVVSARACALTWGVVFGLPVMGSADHRVYAVIFEHLVNLLRERRCDLRCYLPSPDGSLANAWQDIERDAQAGRLRVLLPLAPSRAIDVQLARSRPLPIIDGHPWTCDWTAMARLGAAHLAAGGRRRAVVVSPLSDCDRAMLDGCAAGGIEPVLVGQANSEAGGFACADAVLRRGERPEAWLVGNDNACRGVLTALLWHGVSIPRDTALITHANRGIALVSPLPLTRLEFEPTEMAAAVLASADALLAGRACEPRVLAPRLVPGASCGEA